MVSTQRFNEELGNLREDIRHGLVELQKQQTQMMNKFKSEMKMVKSLLLDISGQSRPVGQPPRQAGIQQSPDIGGYGGFMDTSTQR